MVEIAVADTGIGISAMDIDRIFDSFEQAGSGLTRKYQGTGLGLFITSRLVELHGDRIWARSRGEGKGSTFSFVIPVNAGEKV